jgi:hypothetical protein
MSPRRGEAFENLGDFLSLYLPIKPVIGPFESMLITVVLAAPGIFLAVRQI